MNIYSCTRYDWEQIQYIVNNGGVLTHAGELFIEYVADRALHQEYTNSKRNTQVAIVFEDETSPYVRIGGYLARPDPTAVAASVHFGGTDNWKVGDIVSGEYVGKGLMRVNMNGNTYWWKVTSTYGSKHGHPIV